MPNPRRIAYQGEPGANSHIVCQEHYPELEALPCASFEDVFSAVGSGEAELAMIPIDNSIAGRVADIHHFLPGSGLHIIAEHFLRIRFHLMAVPGASLESIRTVHSHVHALGQCRRIIREHGLTPLISGDTAGAAREVAEAADPSQASISPPLAAQIYGLDVLATDVEDEDHNTTRFVVLSRDFVQAPAGNGPVVTSFVFNVRNLPAALYKALGGFATNGVNMTKLESYMVDGHFHRDAVPRRGRRAPRRDALAQRAGGAGLLHHRRDDPGGLPRGPVPLRLSRRTTVHQLNRPGCSTRQAGARGRAGATLAQPGERVLADRGVVAALARHLTDGALVGGLAGRRSEAGEQQDLQPVAQVGLADVEEGDHAVGVLVGQPSRLAVPCERVSGVTLHGYLDVPVHAEQAPQSASRVIRGTRDALAPMARPLSDRGGPLTAIPHPV